MDIRFADPWILLLLLAVPALAAFAFWFRRTPSVALGSIALAGASPRTWRLRVEPVLVVLRLTAITVLIVSLARPQRGEAVTRAELEGVDIILAYDVSSSMSQVLAQGVSRLDAAEDVLTRFIGQRDGDRVGLVVFKDSTLTLSPLTTDYHAVAESVKDAPRLRLADGTAIGSAIASSLNALLSSQSESRIVILLTDGVNNSEGLEPLAAAKLAQELGVRVYTVGVVSPGVETRSQSTLNVDETALKEIANLTGGTYNRAEDPDALQDIYDSIDRLEKSRFEGAAVKRYNDIASFALVAAATVLALEVCARATFFRRAA